MIGEILITLGVLLFAFLVWQLWWTDVVGNRAQAQIVAELPFEPLPTPTPSGSSTAAGDRAAAARRPARDGRAAARDHVRDDPGAALGR